MAFFNYPSTSVPEGFEEDAIFLRGATRDDWDTIIERFGMESFVARQVVVEGGTPGDAFFILIDGAVDVVAKGTFGERVVTRIGPGSIFGEIAFLDEGVRTATIRAAQNGTLVRVTRDGFALLAAWQPALAHRMLWDIGRICAQRLRRALAHAARSNR